MIGFTGVEMPAVEEHFGDVATADAGHERRLVEIGATFGGGFEEVFDSFKSNDAPGMSADVAVFSEADANIVAPGGQPIGEEDSGIFAIAHAAVLSLKRGLQAVRFLFFHAGISSVGATLMNGGPNGEQLLNTGLAFEINGWWLVACEVVIDLVEVAGGIGGDDGVGSMAGRALEAGTLLVAHGAADVAGFAERADVVEGIVRGLMQEVG